MAFNENGLKSYLSCLNDCSRCQYDRSIHRYEQMCQLEGWNPHTSESACSFAEELHKDGLKTSTLWTIMSAINAYFEYGLGENFHVCSSRQLHCFIGVKLKTDAPAIHKKLELWQKSDDIKKAPTFTEANIEYYLSKAPDDAINLPVKVALILSIFGFLRLNELHSLLLSSLQKKDDVYVATLLRYGFTTYCQTIIAIVRIP
jgi:hypothetical protein